MHQSIQNNIWAGPRQTSIKTISRTSIPWLSPDKHVSACKKPGTNIGSAFHHAAIYHLEIIGPVWSAGKIYHKKCLHMKRDFRGPGLFRTHLFPRGQPWFPWHKRNCRPRSQREDLLEERRQFQLNGSHLNLQLKIVVEVWWWLLAWWWGGYRLWGWVLLMTLGMQKVIEIDYGVNTTLLGASGFSFFLPREFKTPDNAR